VSILRASSSSRNLPTTNLDDDSPLPRPNPVATAYLWGRQAGLRSEIDRAPGGLNEEEARAFLDGVRDGRLARHPHDLDLDVEFPFESFDSADEWPETDEIDGYRYTVS
jgi:hypothetical protein